MVDSWKFGVTLKYTGGGSTTRWFPDNKSREQWINEEKLRTTVWHVDKKKR